MIEVVPHGNGFIWRMICAAGRVLAYTMESFPCVDSAFAAGRAYRTQFWQIAAQVDHRMGACI